MMYRFMLDYDFRGNRFTVEIPADDWTDAQRRLMAIQRSGRISGKIEAKVPVPGFISRLIRRIQTDG